MVGLGDLPGGSFLSRAYAISSDGSVVAGQSETASGLEAFIWDQANGIQNLKDLLVNDYGLDLTGWTLYYATDISDDGLTITGIGQSPNYSYEGWIATIPEPATLSLLALGGLALLRRNR